MHNNSREEQLYHSELNNNEFYEVYYYGEIEKINGENYILNTDDAPVKIIVVNTQIKEEFVIFDGAYQGYNNMFCDQFEQVEVTNRKLSKLAIPPVKIQIEKQFGIDYEEEREDYDIDEMGFVTLINGQKMTWEDVKKNGFDWIEIIGITEDGEKISILDLELA